MQETTGKIAEAYRKLNNERHEAIGILRGLCAEFGDNQWDHTTPLPVVLEQHLGDYLRVMRGLMLAGLRD